MNYHKTTKQDLKTIIKNWETMSTKELSEKTGMTKRSVSYMAKLLRKGGFNLPKKGRIGYLKNILTEIKTELPNYLK